MYSTAGKCSRLGEKLNTKQEAAPQVNAAA